MTDADPAISPRDRAYISQQIGREPDGVTAVAARDALGRPAVITNHPIHWLGQQPVPFPTLYWLIDPVLSKVISDLERRGGVGRIEALLAQDPALKHHAHDDHQRYAQRRWAMLSQDEQQLAIDHGFAESLRRKGIGGTANLDAVKCLHMHAAYHLAQIAIDRSGTTVGRLMREHGGIRFMP
ncbi:MAG: DUF501 domain-containing protein [Planctomycetota bacterium]